MQLIYTEKCGRYNLMVIFVTVQIEKEYKYNFKELRLSLSTNLVAKNIYFFYKSSKLSKIRNKKCHYFKKVLKILSSCYKMK